MRFCLQRPAKCCHVVTMHSLFGLHVVTPEQDNQLSLRCITWSPWRCRDNADHQGLPAPCVACELCNAGGSNEPGRTRTSECLWPQQNCLATGSRHKNASANREREGIGKQWIGRQRSSWASGEHMQKCVTHRWLCEARHHSIDVMSLCV